MTKSKKNDKVIENSFREGGVLIHNCFNSKLFCILQ